MKHTLCCLLFVSAPMFAQTISGVVKDPQAKAVAGASISILARDGDTRRDTTSDAEGAYRFEGIAPGEYVIQAQAPGFSRFVTKQVRIARGQNMTLDLPLALAATAQQVVVTASSTPQTTDETSKAITVIDRADIDQRDESQISEAVRPAPGVRVQQL